MDTPLVIIKNCFEIILDRNFRNNKNYEEIITFKKVTFKDNSNTKEIIFNRELFISDLLKSQVYIRQLVKGSYDITSMIFPWFEPADDSKNNSFIIHAFRMIILRII